MFCYNTHSQLNCVNYLHWFFENPDYHTCGLLRKLVHHLSTRHQLLTDELLAEYSFPEPIATTPRGGSIDFVKWIRDAFLSIHIHVKIVIGVSFSHPHCVSSAEFYANPSTDCKSAKWETKNTSLWTFSTPAIKMNSLKFEYFYLPATCCHFCLSREDSRWI